METGTKVIPFVVSDSWKQIASITTDETWQLLLISLGSCYEKVRQKTAEMRAQLEKDDTYFFDQTSNDLQTMAEKHGVSTEMKSERKRYSEELSWWSDNLKKKVV